MAVKGFNFMVLVPLHCFLLYGVCPEAKKCPKGEEMPPDPTRSSLNCANPHCFDCMNHIELYFELYDIGNMEEKVKEMSGLIEEMKKMLQDQQTATSSSKG